CALGAVVIDQHRHALGRFRRRKVEDDAAPPRMVERVAGVRHAAQAPRSAFIRRRGKLERGAEAQGFSRDFVGNRCAVHALTLCWQGVPLPEKKRDTCGGQYVTSTPPGSTSSSSLPTGIASARNAGRMYHCPKIAAMSARLVSGFALNR